MALTDHFEKLRYFAEVARQRSINRASLKLRISQPSLSVAIKILEEELNAVLFIRSKAGVTLTEDGERLLRFANQFIREASVVEGEIRNRNKFLEGELRIATHESISIYFFPDFILFLRAAYPDLSISLITGRSRMAVESLTRGDVDIAVSVDPPGNRAFNSQVLFADCFRCYAAPELPSKFMTTLILMSDAFESSGSTLIARLGSGIDRFNQIMHCENHETVRALCERGLGVGLVPTLVVRDSLRTGRLVECSRPGVHKRFSPHNIVMSRLGTSNRDTLVNKVSEELIRFARNWGAIPGLVS